MRSIFFAAVIVLDFLNQGASENVGPCVCHPTWAKCDSGGGEDGFRGCGHTGKSCADICPGDYEWKPLYRKSVEIEAELQKECSGDPTAKWGPMSAGRFQSLIKFLIGKNTNVHLKPKINYYPIVNNHS